jgi:8-oxo-dGTP pyrophosphatase MutT (NUDIX family)
MQLYTVGLLMIKERKLLLAYSNNKQCFYLPGGKIDSGETSKKALCREIAEELNLYLKEDELVYYTHITAPAYGEAEGVIMEQDCFFTTKNAAPVASAEISEINFFSLVEYKRQPNKAPGAIMVLKKLKEDNFID